MTFHGLPNATDPAGLSTALRDGLWLNRRSLKLERWCAEGGSIDWDTLEILNISSIATKGLLQVSCSIYFTEVSQGGCADTEIHEEREALIALRIDVVTGGAYLW